MTFALTLSVLAAGSFILFLLYLLCAIVGAMFCDAGTAWDGFKFLMSCLMVVLIIVTAVPSYGIGSALIVVFWFACLTRLKHEH